MNEVGRRTLTTTPTPNDNERAHSHRAHQHHYEGRCKTVNPTNLKHDPPRSIHVHDYTPNSMPLHLTLTRTNDAANNEG